MVIKRVLLLPERTFLLLGPRGTGKSTLIKQQIKFDIEIDLLKSKNFLPLSANPSLIEEWTQHLKKGAWIYIDEIQKIPALMDEVHSLYEAKRFNFALSGSSARKLKRGGGNLLAGRALSAQLFPFLHAEYSQSHSIEDAMQWGSMPQVVTEPKFRQDYLSSYVETYLKEELMEEGAIRKLEPFFRFLRWVGIYNGQILNTENIARESHIGRTTVDKYFDILSDTLLGHKLLPFQPKWNRKESTHAKFYLFDVGVARGCAGLLSEDLDPSWLEFAFETLVVNEVRAYNQYLNLRREIFYYKYSAGYEIDLVIETQKKTLSKKQLVTMIEIKSSKKWDVRWNLPLLDIKEKSNGRVSKIVGIYRGQKTLEFGELKIFPVEEFFNRLANGEFLN
jgi:uncharacterized protein